MVAAHLQEAVHVTDINAIMCRTTQSVSTASRNSLQANKQAERLGDGASQLVLVQQQPPAATPAQHHRGAQHLQPPSPLTPSVSTSRATLGWCPSVGCASSSTPCSRDHRPSQHRTAPSVSTASIVTTVALTLSQSTSQATRGWSHSAGCRATPSRCRHDRRQSTASHNTMMISVHSHHLHSL
jgi:hypothetical protein